MKSRIIQKLCSTLLTFALVAGIIACSLSSIPTNEPPQPKKQFIVAGGHGVPLIVHIWGWIKGLRRGGSGSGKSPMPKPN